MLVQISTTPKLLDFIAKNTPKEAVVIYKSDENGAVFLMYNDLTSGTIAGGALYIDADIFDYKKKEPKCFTILVPEEEREDYEVQR